MTSEPLRALLDSAPRLLTALDEAIAAGAGGQLGLLAPVAGLHEAALARLAYRLWLERAPAWGPLVQLDPRHLASGKVWGPLTEAMEQADRGWLYLATGWPDIATAEELVNESGGRVHLLAIGDGPRLLAGTPLVRRLEHLDRFHLVATDPGLAPFRQALLAHCRASAVLHLSGPAGAGKRSLVCWAHALLDTRLLSRVRAGFPEAAVPGCWQLYEDLGRLEPQQLGPLRQRLQAEGGGGSWGEAAAARPKGEAFVDLIGNSPGFLRALDRAARFAASSLPLLITGPMGSGRTVLAEAIHAASGRTGPLLTIDLHVREPTLLSAGLLGDGGNGETGELARAEGGTLVLDGLEFLPIGLQARLLRRIDARERAGREGEARLVAIAGSDLEAMGRSGEFRRDLLARFHPAARIALPGLKERAEDLVPLLEHFAMTLKRRPRFTAEARQALSRWSWPGNIRELRQLVEAAAFGEDRELGIAELEALLPGSRQAPMLVTSNGAPEERQRWPFPRCEIHRLTAVTLQIPPLAERGTAAVRHTILNLVEGRPVRNDLLQELGRAALWGNYTGLKATLQAACGGQNGATGLSAQLPGLLGEDDRAPIKALLFPTVYGGKVAGMERSFPERGLVLGRVASLQELDDGNAVEARVRLSLRREAIQTLLGSTPPGWLCLGFLNRLSRAHCVVVRDDGELVAHLLPGAALPVTASSLEGGVFFPVGQDQPVALGRGGSIRILDKPDGAIYLELFLFLGAAAFDDLEPLLATRLQKPVTRTLGASAPRMRSWRLNSRECDALLELVLEAARSSHPFATCLRKTARRWQEWDAALARLAHYLDSAHPAQSCGRLLASKENEAARSRLARLLEEGAASRKIWLKLPAAIRKLVPTPD